MPLATHPGETFRVVLSTDENMPADKQPAFIFRYVSTLEWQVLAKISNEFERTVDSDKMLELAFMLINRLLVGWEKMSGPDVIEIPFEPEKLPGMLSLGETTELMMAAISQRPSLIDKKKLDSPPDSNMVQSAKIVKG